MLASNIACPDTAHTLEAGLLNISDIPTTGFDFQCLAPLEMVTAQFPRVSFGCAIALNPSNPRFTNNSDQRVLMPTGNENRMSIALDDSVDSFCLWGRCTQPILLKVLEKNGKVIKIHSDKAFRQSRDSDTELLSLQILKLENMGDIAMIELSANAPFTIEGLSI